MAAKHEVSLAASYYVLFSNLNSEQETPSQGESQSAGVFWEEDLWTPKEEAEAEQTLIESRERCNIRSNGLVSTDKKEDEQAWNKFYSSHQTNFFKDRHYLHKAFPDEFLPTATTTQQRTLVEIGCGVGNALLPLLEDEKDDSNNIQWTVHGLDLSKVAIEWLKQDERFLRATQKNLAHAYVCDISAPGFPQECQNVADVTTLLFCLSAIAPGEPMIQAVQNVASTLKPNNGVLVFRDYGRYDEAQMKLGTSRNKQLDDDNFYRKHDGTKCFYFSLDDVRKLFEEKAGLNVLELKYLRRIYRNRGTNEVRRRVWVQGRFQKAG